VVNIFLYLHFSRMMGGEAVLPPQLWALMVFVFGMSLVIAWFKDIPDTEGDRHFSIVTLTLKLGARRVFNIGLTLLTVCYLGMVVAGLAGLPGVNLAVLVAGHLSLLLVLWRVALRIRLEEKNAIRKFYMFIWLLFFAEYLLFAAACLTA
jgi:homogentisate phytyltransferase/homogentisate geranylgeranyltransferase